MDKTELMENLKKAAEAQKAKKAAEQEKASEAFARIRAMMAKAIAAKEAEKTARAE